MKRFSDSKDECTLRNGHGWKLHHLKMHLYIYIYIYISPFDGDFYRYVTQKVRWLEFFGRKVVAPSWASLPSIPGKSSQHSWCFSIKNGCLRKKGDHSQRALLIHRSTTSFLLCVRKIFLNFQIFLDDVKISLGFVNFWIAFVMPELSDEYPMLLRDLLVCLGGPSSILKEVVCERSLFEWRRNLGIQANQSF